MILQIGVSLSMVMDGSGFLTTEKKNMELTNLIGCEFDGFFCKVEQVFFFKKKSFFVDLFQEVPAFSKLRLHFFVQIPPLAFYGLSQPSCSR